MKLNLLVAVASASLVFIPNVAMAEWIQVGSSRSGNSAWVDDESIAQYDGIVGFRLKMDNGRSRVLGNILANCPTSQFQYQDLKVNGVVNYPPHGATDFPLETAPSGTIYGAAIQYACGAH